LRETTKRVYGFLKSEGAVFFSDICDALDLDVTPAASALIELVMAGLVTNDSLEALRKIIQHGSPQPQERRPFSSLEADLARRRERLGPRARKMARRPSRAKYQAAKRRVRQRLDRVPQIVTPETSWVGRWTLVHRFGVMGKETSLEERVTRQTRQLLARYGIVTRDCLSNEAGGWDWHLIYQMLQRMEMRGEVRRGYFVQGLSGAQFALPDVVERLRAVRDGGQFDNELVVMNACDPANLYGPGRDDVVDDAPRTAGGEALTFARVPSTWLVLHRGLPVFVAGNTCTNITTTLGVDDGLVQRALKALLSHLARFEHRVTVEEWNGEQALESPGQALLESIGFYRDYPAMAWEQN
jgi:ATP-dependent Lhr-like helicase